MSMSCPFLKVSTNSVPLFSILSKLSMSSSILSKSSSLSKIKLFILLLFKILLMLSPKSSRSSLSTSSILFCDKFFATVEPIKASIPPVPF